MKFSHNVHLSSLEVLIYVNFSVHADDVFSVHLSLLCKMGGRSFYFLPFNFTTENSMLPYSDDIGMTIVLAYFYLHVFFSLITSCISIKNVFAFATSRCNYACCVQTYDCDSCLLHLMGFNHMKEVVNKQQRKNLGFS